MESLPVPKEMAGTVVDLRPEFKRKQWRSKYRWDITPEILDRIAADLWPGLAGASEIKAARGTAPKRPPLTSDARDKIGELHRAVSDIGSAIDDLSEVALKGFAFEARRISQAYSDGRHDLGGNRSGGRSSAGDQGSSADRKGNLVRGSERLAARRST
jgi:hypothetical protein